MNKLVFKKIAAENFLCFGEKAINIDIKNYGNIVLIKGENLDIDDEEEKIASNGTGKSSIPEIICYTLYGKTIKQHKKITHKDVINNKTKKKLRTEVCFDKYRVVRTRKPESLRIWESEDGVWDDNTEITVGGMPETQKLIEEKIGLTYDSFINIVVFTDNNSGSFLECDAAEKREIVENLLSLEKYKQFSENSKLKKNDLKEKIKLISKSYEHLLRERDSCKNRIEQVKTQEIQWKNNKQLELNTLLKKQEEFKSKLENTDGGQALERYNSAQEKIIDLNKNIPELIEKKNTIISIETGIKEKLDLERKNKVILDEQIQKLNLQILNFKNSIESNKKTIDSFNKKKNTKCPSCFGIVKEENYLDVIKHAETEINLNSEKLNSSNVELAELSTNLIKVVETIKNLSDGIKLATEKSSLIQSKLSEIQAEITTLSKINKPEITVNLKIIENQLQDIASQINNKLEEINGKSPFVDIMNSVVEEFKNKQIEVEEKSKELKTSEQELPYYDFWVKAFGDNGIRKFIIDGIIPALNSRIEYWLQFLINGKIKLTFDNQLDEIIQRNPSDGDPFVYYAMSGGERRRLNLAVSQAFAHIRMLNAGTSPSIVFLDEVTTNIDPIGVQGVYNMISELSKEKQVFITTHDHDLLQLLSGCDTIQLQKKDGFTTVLDN